MWAYAASLAMLETLGAAKDNRAAEMHYLASCAYAENVLGCLAAADIERALEVLAEKGLIRWVGKVAAKRLLLAFQAYQVLSPLGACLRRR